MTTARSPPGHGIGNGDCERLALQAMGRSKVTLSTIEPGRTTDPGAGMMLTTFGAGPGRGLPSRQARGPGSGGWLANAFGSIPAFGIGAGCIMVGIWAAADPAAA